MKKVCKVITLLLLFCFIFHTSVYASDVLTVKEKADVLENLKIVAKTDGEFKLTSQLKRSDAAVFVVRLMGKESFVLDNSKKYRVTKFPDVSKDLWYAPYVGYCVEQKIIGGYKNGKFGPSDNISEKAFLKIVLGALGYVYNTDFSINEIYNLSYTIGLVDDKKYITQKNDNTTYLKEDAAKVLYNAVNKEIKDAGKTILQNLVDTKTISRNTAVTLGYLKDDPVTKVNSVTVNDGNRITVQFNEEIKDISLNNISLYESDNISNKLTLTKESQSGNIVVLDTSNHVPEKDYTIDISKVEDSEGNVIDNVRGTFKGYKQQEVKSDFFKISKVEPVSRSVIHVYFTHPINMNAELPSFYEIKQNDVTFESGSFQTLNVKVLRNSDNAISIMLKNKTFLDGAPYSIKISGDLQSAYGTKLNDGTGDTMNFSARADQDEPFYVKSVVPVDTKTIQVEYNRDVDYSSALQNLNYTIQSSNGVTVFSIKATMGDIKGRLVRLSLAGTLDKTKNYELIVNNVYDSFKVSSITTSKYPFSGQVPDKSDLVVINAYAEDKGTLVVFFDRPLEASSAINTSLYSISGVTSPGFIASPSKVFYDPVLNPYMVKLYIATNNLAGSSNSYKLRVFSTMQDDLGRMSSANSEYTFNGSEQENFKPMMTEARIISKDSIKVRLSEEILSGGLNTSSSNYVLEYRDGSNTVSKSPTSVSYMDATTLIIRFDTLDFGKNYTLRFTGSLTDYSNLNSRTPAEGLNSVSVTLGS